MMVNSYSNDILPHHLGNRPHTPERANCFTRLLFTYLPILTWLPKYTLYDLQCDFIAGVTVGLMVIPQGLAYASIARLTNDYGLYSSFMGCFVYCIFGTSKDITIGPTAILSLMVSTYNIPHCGDLAVLFSLYVGIILLFMGIFHLGFLVKFVSVPVISAFTSAAAITIACGQIKDLNGIAHTPRDFFQSLIQQFKQIKSWNYYDLGYGIGCMIILLLMRQLSKLKWQTESMAPVKMICWKFLWLCGIARNALIVIISCLIIYILDTENIPHYFTLIDDINFGLPKFWPASFNVHCDHQNVTLHFVDTLNQFGTGLAVVPLLAFMEAMAIGKAFSRINNYKIKPTQELIALGLANICGSFVSAYPVTGSFSRTAVNSQSGVKTPIAGLFTGTVVILATRFLTQMFQYIPKACLGAVIISAVLCMVDFKVIKSIWVINRIDIIPFALTFAACFYTLEAGLLVGIIVSLFIVLYPVVNPRIEEDLKEITILRVHNGLFYPGIEKIIGGVEDVVRQPNPPIVIIIDMFGVTNIDFTVVSELHEVIKQMREISPGTELLVTNVCFQVKRVLIMAGLHDIITSSENVSERYQEGQRLLYD